MRGALRAVSKLKKKAAAAKRSRLMAVSVKVLIRFWRTGAARKLANVQVRW
jgi:hypothetical protein